MGKKGKERFRLQNIERHVIVLLEKYRIPKKKSKPETKRF